MKARIFGLTGTNGKTTTKEFAAAVLGTKLRVQYSAGSFNNHWGVPISLLSIDSSHEAAVIEMGMNHLGELETLSKIVEPDVVLCTMVGQGHLEGVGSVEGVAKAKSEIYEFAPSHAVKIFNLENPYTRKMYSDWGQRLPPAQRFTFAGFSWEKTASHLSSSQVVIPASDVAMDVVAAGLDWISVKGRIREVHGEARVPVFGRQNITNIMAAACFGLVAGLSPQEIWAALPMCRTAWGRNQWVALHSGAQVLFDAYNANPESMRAAVENFAQLQTDKQGRKMAVLGEMRELGARTPDLHRELGRQVARAGFDAVAFIGPSKASFQEGLEAGGFSKKLFITDTYEDSLASHVLPVLDQSDIVLFKGSRGMRLEKVLEALKPIDFHSKK
jgi:UDP-N-acetylmuramoyl-tripeptide--D-alanyl-D-alanine ligase